ncbi:MAG: hypothetical protein RBU21_08520 [FCB group bacterium]|nr:hypothetical protein [FCB group bacterium]
MPNDDLVERMKIFFDRQKRFCESCLEDMETTPADVEDETLAPIVERHRLHAVGREALEKEFAGLRAEWDADTRLTDAQRAEVRKVSDSLEPLRKRLAERNAEWKKWVDQRMLGLTKEITDLARGRADVARYDNTRSMDASFIDEKI